MKDLHLDQFNLTFPGLWIADEDREWAFHIRHNLSLVENLFVEAVAAYGLFRPITRENVDKYIEQKQSRYEACLNGLYAKAFVFALHGIEKLLQRLCHKSMHPPSGLQLLYRDYRSQFGHLKHIRDSAIHIEDRGRGVARDQKPIPVNILVLGSFIEKRFTFTGEDGKHYEIEISDKTLLIARDILQKVIDVYTWIGLPWPIPENPKNV
jgi:hypothetical protein